jgi:hypothetical protein
MNTATKLVAFSIAMAVPAHAGGVLHDLASEVAAKLDALRAAHVPAVPVPVVVKWKPQRVASVELGAPLVAMTAGDIGDGHVELFVVTTREVIAFAINEHHLKELGRASFVGEPAVPGSRDPVGASVIEERVLYASSSAFAHGVKVTWQNKQLVAAQGATGFELCAGEHAVLVAGRNYFGDAKNGYYGVQCRDLADPAGKPRRARALLGMTGKLDVALDQAHFQFAHVGTAYALADLERDGTPELVFASGNAPGEADEVRVVALGEDEKKPKWKKAFTAGGVAALAVGDFDNAPTAIAAVRLIGSTRVDLWRLN